MLGVCEGFVFAKGKFGAEEEVGEGAFVKDAVDDDLLGAGLEVEAPVCGAEAVEGDAIALDFSEALVIELFEVFFGDFELFEEFELFEGSELGDFRSRDFIKDDLEHGGSLADNCLLEKVDLPLSRRALAASFIEG